MPDIRNNTSIENVNANAATRYELLSGNTYAIVRGLGGDGLTALQNILAALGGGATTPQHVDTSVYVPNGLQQVVTVTNAITIMAALPANTTHVQLQVQTADCRVTIDGTNPTAGGNFVLLEDGDETLWTVDMATAARFIRETATNSIIIVWPLRASL